MLGSIYPVGGPSNHCRVPWQVTSFAFILHCLLHYRTPLHSSPQLQHSCVDRYVYQPNQPIPCCQLQLQWMKTEVPHGKLSHHLKLIGANPPETYIEIFRNLPVLGRTAATLKKASVEAVSCVFMSAMGSICLQLGDTKLYVYHLYSSCK